MSVKNYSEEFRRQAIDLYESTPGATLRSVAADLGVERNTLGGWVNKYGSGTKTAPDGGTITTVSGARRRAVPQCGPETVEEKIARLEAENAALRAGQALLSTERDILRAAAKYFAGETNW
jgi:transposase